MAGWSLGIDFGTSSTVAATHSDGVATLVDLESNGSSRIASSVFLNIDGEILVGSAAQHQAVFEPDRFEPTPKRALGEGEIFLGDRLVPVVELAAAVLRRAYVEASRQQGEIAPTSVQVTHPADWNDVRLTLLRDAIATAGIPSAELIPEPVAAAARIATSTTAGQLIGVYDFGGGTFDAAVLRRTRDGFEVAGPPSGRDPLGGEDIDARIITHLGSLVTSAEQSAWASLLSPPDVGWRRQAAALREEVRRAKETLSETSAAQLWLPGIDRGVQLTRGELEKLIEPDVEATVDALAAALLDAGTTAGELAGLYLVGGSSRIPLVSDVLWRRLGVRPAVQESPKSVVALGAAAWPTRHRPEPPKTWTVTSPAVSLVRPQLLDGGLRPTAAADLSRQVWAPGCTAVVQLFLDRVAGDPLTIRLRDEPTTLSVERVAAQSLERRSARSTVLDGGVNPTTLWGQPALERVFRTTLAGNELEMRETYLVYEARAIVVATPLEGAEVVAGMRLTPQADGLFSSRITVPDLPGWTAGEQLIVYRNGTRQSLSIEHSLLLEPLDGEAWRARQLESLHRALTGARERGRVPSQPLGGLPGDVTTVGWTRQSSPMLTKLGTAVSGSHCFAVTMTLPHQEQNQFGALARHIRLRDDAFAPNGR